MLNLPFPLVFCDYNDLAGTERTIREVNAELAAVIVEPMMGGGGCIPAHESFLRMLRRATTEVGALLIFDEVITSRLAYRGMHGVWGIRPDMVTMGKYLGGGSSFGAFGGRADIMDRFDPAAPNAFSHGGTFNNNVLSMAGGLTAFTKVLTEEASRQVNDLGDVLRTGMNDVLDRHDILAVVLGRGSMMNLHFETGFVDTPAPLDKADRRYIGLWHTEMLLRGQHVTPRGMLALSIPTTQKHVDAFIAAFEDFIQSCRTVLPRRG